MWMTWEIWERREGRRMQGNLGGMAKEKTPKVRYGKEAEKGQRNEVDAERKSRGEKGRKRRGG